MTKSKVKWLIPQWWNYTPICVYCWCFLLSLAFFFNWCWKHFIYLFISFYWAASSSSNGMAIFFHIMIFLHCEFSFVTCWLQRKMCTLYIKQSINLPALTNPVIMIYFLFFWLSLFLWKFNEFSLVPFFYHFSYHLNLSQFFSHCSSFLELFLHEWTPNVQAMQKWLFHLFCEPNQPVLFCLQDCNHGTNLADMLGCVGLLAICKDSGKCITNCSENTYINIIYVD